MSIEKTDIIIVTGGRGFLGQHLVRNLKNAGYTNVGIVSRQTGYDLRNWACVEHLFTHARPNVVIHLAASVGGIGANQKQPGAFFRDNILMGLHLIEEARLRGIKKFVQLGTVCSYPKFAMPPFTEDDLWDGYPEQTNAPYGIAKKALLVMLQAYRQQYGLNGIFLMPTNLYGPGDNFDLETSHVIPAIIRKMDDAIKNRTGEVSLWGSGNATREFLYVEDCAEAIRLAMEKYNEPAPMNLGTEDNEVRIVVLARLIANIMGFRGKVCFDTSKPDGQPRRALDTSCAFKYLGWSASTELVDGLQKTIEWYRHAYSNV